MKPSQVLAALPGLSKPDLAAIRAAADSLLGSQVSAGEQAATPLFDALCRALGLRLGWAEFQRTATYKPYKRGAHAIAGFLGSTFPMAENRSIRNALHSFMLECLIGQPEGAQGANLIGQHVQQSESAHPKCSRRPSPATLRVGLLI